MHVGELGGLGSDPLGQRALPLGQPRDFGPGRLRLQRRRPALRFKLLGAAAQRPAFLGKARYLYLPRQQSGRIAPSGRGPDVTTERHADKRHHRGRQCSDTYQDAYIHRQLRFSFLLCSYHKNTIWQSETSRGLTFRFDY